MEATIQEFEASGSQVRPWVRFCARGLDTYLWGLSIGIASAFVYPKLLEVREILLGLLIVFTYIPVEALLLSTSGTTPGKALLRVRLRKLDGQKLGLGGALERCFYVWTRGMGAGIPLLALFTQLYAYNRLSEKGSTSWDDACGLRVTHQTLGVWRVVIAVLVYLGFVALSVYGKFG